MTTFEIVFRDGETLEVEAEKFQANGGWLSFVVDRETEVQEPKDRQNGGGVEMVTVMRPRPFTVCAVNLSEVRHYGPKAE